MTWITATQAACLATEIKQRHKEAYDYLGDEEEKYVSSLCILLMDDIVYHVNHGQSSGSVKFRLNTNVNIEEGTGFPDWLETRAIVIKAFFEQFHYRVSVEKNAERHGFGDWERWWGVDITISW